jgi:hypothetical protein
MAPRGAVLVRTTSTSEPLLQRPATLHRQRVRLEREHRLRCQRMLCVEALAEMADADPLPVAFNSKRVSRARSTATTEAEEEWPGQRPDLDHPTEFGQRAFQRYGLKRDLDGAEAASVA